MIERIGVFLLAVLLASTVCVATFSRPKSEAASIGEWLLADLHVHTSNSSDADASPEEVVRIYEDAGYDILAVTDHDFFTRAESEKLIIVPGMEWSYVLRRPYYTHLSVLFINEKPNSLIEAFEQGAFISLNHPATTSPDDWLLNPLEIQNTVTGFEIYNQRYGGFMSFVWELFFPGKTAGSDAHRLNDYAKTRVWVYAERNLESIKDALKKGLVSVGEKPAEPPT